VRRAEKRSFCFLFSAPAKKEVAVKAEQKVRITYTVEREARQLLQFYVTASSPLPQKRVSVHSRYAEFIPFLIKK